MSLPESLRNPCLVIPLSDLVLCLFGPNPPSHFHPLQMRVGGDVTDVQLTQLFPNTAYTLSIFALHGESASDPLTEQGVTRTYRWSY